MKNICNIVGIDTNNRSITNHSERSTSITALFRQRVPMVTTMAITGHKSESSYRVYTRPSKKDKEDALSSLINNIELPLKQDNPFRTPLKDLTQPIEQQKSYKYNYQTAEDRMDGNVIVKNYYITADK
ncbi:12706_t:CDS:2, partial [Racocetra fulgida]